MNRSYGRCNISVLINPNATLHVGSQPTTSKCPCQNNLLLSSTQIASEFMNVEINDKDQMDGQDDNRIPDQQVSNELQNLNINL